MTHSYGRNRKTRSIFSRKFREHGPARSASYMQVYRLGQYVDIKVNGSVHKGMPHRLYVGRTGKYVYLVEDFFVTFSLSLFFDLLVCLILLHNPIYYTVLNFHFLRVWNVSKRAIGVEVNKKVGNRIFKKRIHVRVEHIAPSRCREDFLNRMKACQQAKKEAAIKYNEAKAAGKKIHSMLCF